MATTVFIVSGTSYTVPSDCSLADSVETIGGGGGGGGGDVNNGGNGGGGGAAYSLIASLSLTPSSSVTIQIGGGGSGGNGYAAGSNGADTWFNGANLAGSSVGSKGGVGAATGAGGAGAGGAAGSGVGTTKSSGGAGGGPGSSSWAGGGGGGAAGPLGAGGAAAVAGQTGTIDNGGGGGGANGGGTNGGAGSTAAGGVGGNNQGGTGSGAGGAVGSPGGAGVNGSNGGGGGGGGGCTGGGVPGGSGGIGGAGTEWDGSHGSGGGGGGGGASNGVGTAQIGGAGALYGGGGGGAGYAGADISGGNGAQGIIVLIYTATVGISFDAASNSGYQTAQSTYSWSHTTMGVNRYLTVGISMLSVGGSSVTSITYNSVALSFVRAQASVSGAVRAEWWGLVAPATGSNTIAVTLSASLDSIGGAASFNGVQQFSPIEGANSATATNVGAADATVDVTTVADNDWVLDVVATDDTAITVGAGQTSRNNVSGTLGSGAMSTEGPKTPAGTVTMSWANVGALATWSIVAVALRPLAASNLGAASGSNLMMMGV